jgi:pantetheine-phosphate adenylyltransferase
MFTMNERVEMLRVACAHIPNVQVDGFSGLLNDYVRRKDSTVIVRGLRALSDFEYEFQRALLMKKVDHDLETVFMMTNMEYSFVSSSGIKELAKFGGSIAGLVPECVEEKVVKRISEG